MVLVPMRYVAGGCRNPPRMLWDPRPGQWRSGVGCQPTTANRRQGPVRVQLALRLVVEDGL